PDQGRSGFRLGDQEDAKAEERESEIDAAEAASPERHGERIAGKRERQDQRAPMVEARASALGGAALEWQMPMGENERQRAQRQVDEEDGPPAERRDQQAAE